MIITNWGYTITGEDTTLGDILTFAEFGEMTNSRFGHDNRIATEISAASAAIRNYCGWHIFPVLPCQFNADSISTGHIVQLPAKLVTSIESVKFAGETIPSSDYVLKTNGLLIFKNRRFGTSYSDLSINYMAGLDSSFAAAVKELVAAKVSHALSQKYGVQSESAGGVSITYSSTYASGVRASSLPDYDKEILAPYKLQGVY